MLITIDGKECECERGEYLLQIARRNGIFITTLCNHEGLGSLGACRLCIVEVVYGGRSQVVTSCLYPVEHEIEAFTDSDKIKEEKSVILALLSRLAPGAKIIRQMASFGGADLPRLTDKKGGDTCILCGRCTTACELVGSGAIAKINRGVTKAISTPYDEASPECIGCAGCAHVCPTESIPFTETDTAVTIWGQTFNLKRCDCCGRPITTDEMIANARFNEAKVSLSSGDEDGAETDDMTLCLVCRKQAVAGKIRAGI